MFSLNEDEITSVRAAFDTGGEFAASVELRRLFPGITDSAESQSMRADHRGLVSTGVRHPEKCQFSIVASASLGFSQAWRVGEPEPGRVALVKRLLQHATPA